MIGLLQRVSQASVRVDNEIVGRIDSGLAVLTCVRREDTGRDAARLAERLLAYRVFADDAGRMNLSLNDTAGGLLLIPQFTLAADTSRGNRASFSKAAPPEQGQALFQALVEECRKRHRIVETGRFGADMQLALVNDGPVTFWLET